jgi:hypothetical protein
VTSETDIALLYRAFGVRQPPARLFATICWSIVVRALALTL